MHPYNSAIVLVLALASTLGTSSSSILPYPPVPERDVSSLCAATTCLTGTVCRVITTCVSQGCFPFASCVPCVPEGVDAICNANRYIYAVLMVKQPQRQSPINRFTPRMCNPSLNNDENGCPKGSVCASSQILDHIGTCCYGKPEPPAVAENDDPVCDQPSDLCGEKCPKGTVCVPMKTQCGGMSYGCKPKPKPGTCPPVPFGNPAFCANVRIPWFCDSDSDCKGDQKCCKTECGGNACFSPS